MTGSAPGYGSRSEEPRCYNCGAFGHWAVACPEPTRQTPAGLAWRNSEQAASRGGRGPPKKPKGPIVTRYAPPPSSMPPTASYQPASGYTQPPGPYSGPDHQYSSHYPPYPPPPSHPPQSYHQQPPYAPHQHQPPSYGPPQHAASSYSAPVGSQPQTPSGYGQPPLHPPAASGSLPPRPTSYRGPSMGTPYIGPLPPSEYHSPANPPPPHLHASYLLPQPPQPPHPPPPHPHYPPAPSRYSPPRYENYGSSRHPPPALPNHAYGPHGRHGPPAPPNSRSSSYRPHSSSGPPPRKHGPPITTPSGRPKPSVRAPSTTKDQPVDLALPPKPSLPAKPPPSRFDTGDPARDYKSKKKADRKSRQRDNRNKDQNGNRGPNKDKRKNGQEITRRDGAQPSNSSAPINAGASRDRSSTLGQPPKADISPKPKKPDDIIKVAEEGYQKKGEEGDEQPEADWKWQLEAIFKSPEEGHWPDEIGTPLSHIYNEDVLLPRKWDAKCLESEFVTADNLAEFIKPVHETKYWPDIQFDPAFVRDAKFPSGEAVKDFVGMRPIARNESLPQEGVTSKKRANSDEISHEREAKRPRSTSHHQTDANRPVDNEQGSAGATLGRLTSENLSKATGEERKRSRFSGSSPQPQEYQRSGAGELTPRERYASRRSSVSSKSSGLDSLEAELLGRGSKPKSSGEEDGSDVREQAKSPMPKRRRPRADSAYSRRW